MSVQFTKQVLSWITCAKRPLTTRELQHAIAVEMEESDLNEDDLPEIKDMISVCAGLITVDEESNIIRLAHYTTQEYFNRTKKRWFPDAETEIAKACVTYLTFNVFEAGFCSTVNKLEARLQENTLYDYAARNWGHHVHMAPVLIQLDELILRFLESDAMVGGACQAMLTYSDNSQRVPKEVKGLHLAAFFDLQKATIELLERGSRFARADAVARCN